MDKIANAKVDIKQIYAEPAKYTGKIFTVMGWVRTVRASNAFGFIELNDGSFFRNLQVVFEDADISNFKEAAATPVGTAVAISGILVETPEAKQPFELKASSIEVEGTCPQDYPLQKKRHSFEYLRTIAHLRPRTNTFAAVFRLRSAAAFAIHKFFQEKGFVYVHTPIVTGSDAEGAGEMFRVTTFDPQALAAGKSSEIDYKDDFFGRPTSLTVSGQLEGEAFSMAFGKIYTFGPTFRAENSNTARHAAEFWMIEPEIAFADINDNMNLAEEMIKYLIDYCLNNLSEEMEFFNSFVDKGLKDRLNSILASDFGRITYTEAVELLQKSGYEFKYPIEWGIDLQTEHERYLTENIFNKPLFVTGYPKGIKAFYMRQNDDGKTVAAMDLLVPGVGEIIGGSQREERFELLESRMKEMGLAPEDYWWYLDLRRYGGVKHAGYGLGFERLIMYLTGMVNIRDVLPYPRTPNSADF